MDEVNFKPSVVSAAIVIWTGWKSRSPFPNYDETAVTNKFGLERGKALLVLVNDLYDEFYLSDARHRFGNLIEMGDAAASQFRSLHPEISEAAVQALQWCYVYDYK